MLRVVHDEAIQEAPEGRFILDDLLREGARRMIAAALEAEVAEYIERYRRRATSGATRWSCATARRGRGR